MPIPHLNHRRNRIYGAVGAGASPTPAPRPRKKRSYSWLRICVMAGTIGLAVSFIFGTILFIWVSRDLPDPNNLSNRQVAESTKIYDRTGTHLLYEVYQDQKRTVVPISTMSPWISKATVAVEDKHFYEHSGIRVISILRAGFNNLIGRRAGSGGASTLTQQLVKNTLVGDERSLFRKIKEAIIALRLERKYSKEQILEMYLNTIPYGSTNYGVEAAAQTYFHKSSHDLDPAEAATLAALIQAPSRYLGNPVALRGRRNLILGLMADQGLLTPEEKAAAVSSSPRFYRNNGILAAPHFVLFVKQQLADQFGENAIDTGGLKVITTIDYDKQVLAQKIVKENGDKFASSSNANNASLVAIDPKTAQILALVGSRDFDNDSIDGQFDVALLGKLQPGSSLKPFVYTAAFEKGYTPDTVLYDVTTDFDLREGNKYTPKNYDGKEHGLVTIRKALQGSLNIPAVKTLYLVGLNNMLDFAKRFGYTTLNDSCQLTMVLGGCLVNLLEHTNAYATLANNGVYHAPVSILKVTDKSGTTLTEWKPTEGTPAVTPEIAATISSVLTNNEARAYIFGLNSTLVLPGRPVAAKTGTTNNSKDAWTMGYVPSLTAGVWVGNTIPAPMKAGGSALAGTIWNQFMRAALASTTPEMFPTPPPNDAVKPVLRGGDGGITLPINKLNGKIAASTTPPDVIIQKTYLPPHDILYYVNKDDPRGPAPINPADDPQYQNWETALQNWVIRLQTAGTPVSLEDPPTEYDTTEASEFSPVIEILSPTPNSTVTSRDFNITVKASAPRGVSRVIYSIDGNTIGTATSYPFSFNYYAQKLTRGFHTLRALAVDDSGAGGAAEATFNLAVDFDSPNVTWFDRSPLTIAAVDFPRAMYLTPFRWADTTDIKIYLRQGTTSKWIYTFNQAEDKLFNNQLFFTWKNAPTPGNYTLRAVLTDNSGKTQESNLDIIIK